jgi:HJR/Mrr/RecB family endonuclease
MEITEITEEEFSNFNLDKNPNIGIFLERYWFKNNNENLLGTVVFDRYDDDWAYIILGKEDDGIYRALYLRHSLVEEEALLLLKLNMSALSQADKIEENLYDGKTTLTSDSNKIIITDINDELKRYFKKYPNRLHDLSSRKFEELVASILIDIGFDVELTKATRDGGTDIIAHIKNAVANFLILVECKKYAPNNKVGVGIIREVAGVHHIKQPSKSLIVTTSTFTQPAINEVTSLNGKIELKDYNDLKKWLRRY